MDREYLKSMSVQLTKTQRQRLRELNVPELFLEKVFENAQERDKAFQKVEKNLLKKVANT